MLEQTFCGHCAAFPYREIEWVILSHFMVLPGQDRRLSSLESTLAQEVACKTLPKGHSEESTPHTRSLAETNLRWELIFIHLQCWEVLPFCPFQRQRCIKILCPKDPDFYTPLALKRTEGQHLPALEVYKNQSPIRCPKR